MFKRLYKSILYRLQRELKPEMIGGFKYAPGKKGIRISSTTHISNPEQLSLGNDVFIGHFNYIDCYKKVKFGRNVYLANYISLLTHSSHNSVRLHGIHYIKDAADLKGLQSGEVEIGDFCLIGPHTTIMPGTKIGKGCLITAYSFVKPGKYPDYSILKGNPAKVVGNTREIDDILLEKYPEIRHKYYLAEYPEEGFNPEIPERDY